MRIVVSVEETIIGTKDERQAQLERRFRDANNKYDLGFNFASLRWTSQSIEGDIDDGRLASLTPQLEQRGLSIRDLFAEQS